MNVEEHVIYKLRNAQISPYPYPHFYVENVFPNDFYEELINSLESDEEYHQYNEHYPDRYFGPDGTPKGCEFMGTERFMKEILSIFAHWLRKSHPDGKIDIASDLRLVRDKPGYRIGPHTDAPWKLVSLLFYLPTTNIWERNGTSVYVPNDPSFKCEGGPHYEFEEFKQIFTAPYRRNSCFCFWKTNRSFHGVEPITDQFHRNVLLYNVYDTNKIPNPDKSVKLGENLAEEPGHGNLESDIGGEPVRG